MYNIRNGRDVRLELSLRGVVQANLDMGFFQETKVIYGFQTRMLEGYCVLPTDAPSRNRGGLAVFYQYSPQFQVKSLHPHRPNLLRFQVASG